jgi:hypothetical protein
MREFKALLATSIAATTLLGASSAQLTPFDYSSNWQPLQNAASTAFSGPGLFGALSGGTATGGAIRRCYGMDSTQGGRNQSIGRYETTWFKMAQGWGPGSTVPGVNIGLVSVQAATDGDLGADTCLSPFFKSTVGSGGHAVSAAVIPGIQPGTTGSAFPTVWESAFQWIGTSVGGPVTLGSDAAGSPLLINLIYEIQGPINGGTSSPQYYVASTTEITGNAPGAPGGVTNGNAAFGSSTYGVPADVSGALSHSRLFAFGSSGLIAGPVPFLSTPGDVEMSSHVGFQTPVLWAINDGNDGAGGADWRVGVEPVSIVDLRLMDNLAGAQTNGDLYWKTTLVIGIPAAAFDPNIVFNQSFFAWSATPATSMLQEPMSWDDLGGFMPPLPGSVVLGAFPTKREGPQTIPATFDGLSFIMLHRHAWSLGTPFSGSDDIFLDGTVPSSGGSSSQMWEGMFDPIISGVSTLTRGPRPIVGTANPNLVGLKLGIAGMGLQIDIAQSHALQITEVGSALTLNFQP